jgi:hypothetical protein
MDRQSTMLQRILSKIGDSGLLDKLAGLQPSDVQSLLIEVFGRLSGKTSPAGLLRDYGQNRFTKPAALNAVSYLKLELMLMTLAEQQGIKPVLLSPAGLLGSCSAMAAVSQNKVLSALRGTEILADPTNMLALLMADKLSSREWTNKVDAVHLCAASRVARAQGITKPGLFAHFGIFGMVSSGRDSGSYLCEIDLLKKHIAFYDDFTRQHLSAQIAIILRRRKGYTDSVGFMERIGGHIQKAFPHIPLEVDNTETDNAYYLGLNFKLMLHVNGQPIEIGDGGFLDWTQKLINNKKERLLISAIGLDRLLTVRGE